MMLMILMFSVLYLSGLELKRNYKVISIQGIIVIFIFTFVEGLRFGRGIDYNIYWEAYIDGLKGHEFEKSYLYNFISELLYVIDVPFQFFIVIMSFVLIVALLIFMKHYKEVVPLALPLFIYFSYPQTENMIRWYFGFSFFLIGLFYLIKKDSMNVWYLFYSFIACSLHYAFLPVPVLFYVIFLLKRPILKPTYSVSIFLGIYFFFKSDIMEGLVDMIQVATFLSDSSYESYVDSADYWLIGGFNGEEVSGRIGLAYMIMLILITYLGHMVIKDKDRKYIYAYNCYLIGLFLYPISKQIELLIRYDGPFYFFISVILATIIYNLSKKIKKSLYVPLCGALLLCFLVVLKGTIVESYNGSEKCYMFVWDQTDETPNQMMNLFKDENHKNAEKQKNL